MSIEETKNDITALVKESISKCLEAKLWYDAKTGNCTFMFRPECPHNYPLQINGERIVYKCKYWSDRK